MMPATDVPPGAGRWVYRIGTPIGEARSRIEIDRDALRFSSDDPFSSGPDRLPWETIRAAGTARMAAMSGFQGRGGPDVPGWMPEAPEWLLLAFVDPGARPFMRRLPQGADRDAIVGALRLRLGARWQLERATMADARAALGLDSTAAAWLGLAGFVFSVFALFLVALLALGIVLAIFTSPVVAVPGGALLGALLLRWALRLHRAADGAAGQPCSPAARANGQAQLQGRARMIDAAAVPTLAPVSGQPSVWWDASVEWQVKNGPSGAVWEQAAGRFGGRIDHLRLEDRSGSLPVWLQGAELALEPHTWESSRDELPPAGAAWLATLGFAWGSATQPLRVVEYRLAVDGPLYVLGAVGPRSEVPERRAPTVVDRAIASLRSGRWRLALVAALPTPMRAAAAVLIGYLDLLTRMGWARSRSVFPEPSEPPVLAPSDRLAWQGDAGLPFVVSDRPPEAALATLRGRAWLLGALGAAALAAALWVLVGALHGGHA